MIRKILLGLAAIVVLFVIIAALQPAEFSVSRQATINASAAAVFPHVNELRRWEAWNPWGKIDPDMKLTYAGPAAGTGASYSWAGNSEVGEGTMTIAESRAPELIRFKLDFLKPFAATHVADFTFAPTGDQTTVTWTMSGEKNFISKAMGLVMSMDKMIGGSFEKGLADLKAVVEAEKRP